MQDVTAESDRKVALWLLTLCALVYGMILLGGVTRLSGSGLSIVDWRPIMGVLPPLSEQDWQQTFDMYKESPEFRKVNAHMTVQDFKGIFWLEYLHRLLGRLIGIAFLLPFLYFVWRGYIRKHEWPRYGLMFVLGGLQGVLGWYMVKSGLIDNPRVSQYRLTAHLLAAIAIYAYMFWIALSLLSPYKVHATHPWFSRTLLLAVLVLTTIISGGFVAGLDAGLFYNTFPKMGNYWIPPDVFHLSPWWRNLFENMAAVQFNHRVLALTTFALIIVYWLYARRADLPTRLGRGVNALLHTAVLQVILGISTLLLVVPLVLAAAHQAVAVLLFTVMLYLCHEMRRAAAAPS
ncbi:MAG TPA: COX15/CtaA family protein [Woeseiaceae bacterium]|nr:COX15/CtaA family protein [Woeseiaceae bacterium]